MKPLALALLLLIGAAVRPADAASIVLTPSPGVVTAGSTFSLAVTVTGVLDGLDPFDEVIAFGFDAQFDPLHLALIDAVIQPPFLDDSAAVGLDAAGSAFPGTQQNPLLLATLTFQALAAGLTNVGIVSSLLDPNQGLFYAVAAPIDLSATLALNITSPAEMIPEPATLWLVTLGATLVRMRRARRTAPGVTR